MRRWICLMALVVFSCSKEAEKPKEKIIPVQVSQAQPRDLPRYLEVHGMLTPAAQAEARVEVGGRILEVYFLEGHEVSKGDLLAQIDPTLYRLKLQEAEAALAQKKTQLLFAQKKLDRYLSLKRENVAAIEYDQLQQDVALHAAGAEADEARLERARIDLENCSIRAPISGKMGRSHIQAESWVSPGANLGVIRNVDSLWIEFALSEKELGLVKEGCLLEAKVPGQEEWPFHGQLIGMDNQIDLKSGTVSVRGAVGNEGKVLWPGQFVQVRLLLGMETDLLLLPIQAVQQNAKGKFVYVVDKENKVSEKNLTLGAERENEVVVLSGLDPEDQVVVKGQLRLYPGASVEIKP